MRNPEGPWIRIENYIYEGYSVPVYYDPLVAKVVSWGQSRDEALSRMLRALEEYVIEGIETTIPFHVWVMRDSNFRRGAYDTSYIDEHYTAKAGDARRKVPVEVAVIAAAIDRLHSRGRRESVQVRQTSRWRAAARREAVARTGRPAGGAGRGGAVSSQA
jgi:acetyl-CoA carboxylase biotin carboxylase subunit